jgi:hypothetical protein
MRALKSFSDYTNILPYASEIFGVYQPLLAWRSEKGGEAFRQTFTRAREGKAKSAVLARQRFRIGLRTRTGTRAVRPMLSTGSMLISCAASPRQFS